jgi:hypothetical protein
MTFGFGIKAGTTSCPEMRIEVQYYEDQSPLTFMVKGNFGTPTIEFSDGTVLIIRTKDGHNEYELIVSKEAMAKVRKQYEE